MVGRVWQFCCRSGYRLYGCQVPPLPVLIRASPAHDPRLPTGLQSVGTSPELMEPDTSDHNSQPQVLTGASPGSMNSAPLSQHIKMTWESEANCPLGGTCFLPHLPHLCSGQGHMGKRVILRVPWASDFSEGSFQSWYHGVEIKVNQFTNLNVQFF